MSGMIPFKSLLEGASAAVGVKTQIYSIVFSLMQTVVVSG